MGQFAAPRAHTKTGGRVGMSEPHLNLAIACADRQLHSDLSQLLVVPLFDISDFRASAAHTLVLQTLQRPPAPREN